MNTLRVLSVLVVGVVGCAWGRWMENMISAAMETAGVKKDDVKAYTEGFNGAIKDVHEAISSVVDKVDWNKLHHVTSEKIKPKLKEGLPAEQCVRTVKIRSATSELLLEEGKLKEINNVKTVTVKIIGETETEINVLFKVMYSQIQLEYLFKCSNILQDVINFEKNGRLLITQNEPVFVNITASVPKQNSVFSQTIKNGECVLNVKSIEAAHQGTMTFDKIKYHHSEIEYTEHTVSRNMNRARKDLKNYIGEGMIFAVETEIRKNNLFCFSPEMTQAPLDCKEVQFKKLTL